MHINKAYIVLLNYNHSGDTVECLESILKLKYSNYQVIIVDNSDTLKPLQELEHWAKGNTNNIETSFTNLIYPLQKKPVSYKILLENNYPEEACSEQVIIIKALTNNGFSAANNVGLTYIKEKGDKNAIIWLLNNDTVITPESLDVIVSQISSIPQRNKIVFGTPLLEYYEPLKIQAIGGRYNKITGTTYHVGENLDAARYFNEDYIKAAKVDYPVGASMIITHDFLINVGFLSEDYFLYYEEIDWVSKAKAKGGNCYILPVFGIYHKQGKSTTSKKNKQKPLFIDILTLRNRIRYAKKYNRKNVWLICFFILAVTIPKRIIKGNFKAVREIINMVLRETFNNYKLVRN